MKTYAKLTLLAMMAAFLLGIHPALGQAIPTQPASRPTENRAPHGLFPIRWVIPLQQGSRYGGVWRAAPGVRPPRRLAIPECPSRE